MLKPEPVASQGLKAAPWWRLAQTALWLSGVALVYILVVWPPLGINLFWNLLIPVAPALLIVLPGLWRNICPMATMSLLPRHLGYSQKLKVPESWVGPLSFISLTALLLIVPARHVSLNFDGPMTAFMLGGGAMVALVMGFLFEWRSGWCSSLCPIHPVEKLYGTAPLAALPNAHCFPCERCTVPCADSTKTMSPLVVGKSGSERLAGQLLIGGFFGFIWTWSHTPDMRGGIATSDIFLVFGFPLAGFALSYGVYRILDKLLTLPKTGPRSLAHFFAVAAACCYYWYRLPALFGVGLFSEDGVLINLSPMLPGWSPLAMQVATTSLIIWFMIFRKTDNKGWSIRPPYADGAKA